MLMAIISCFGLHILNGCQFCDLCCNDCGTHGQCDEVDGSCVCERGFDHDRHGLCNAKGNAKFAGAWKATETCGVGKSYVMMISPVSDNLERITIFNFADKLCGNDSLIVTAQILRNTDGHYTKATNFTTLCPNVVINSLETNLMLKKDTLVFNYKMNYNGQDYSCSANLRKL